MLILSDIDLKNLRLLIREDFNVPLNEQGHITDDTRIRRALPTIQQAIQAQAKVILISHLGRPKEGQIDAQFSLLPVAERLSEYLKQPVTFVRNWLNGPTLDLGPIVLCENVRFHQGENNNDPELAKKMAALCDLFVMDAFACAHRKQASTYGVAQYAPKACAGPLLVQELNALKPIIKQPKKPITAIVGGSKVSTKMGVLTSLIKNVDCLIAGGGIANTLLKAKGFPIGRSLYEPNWVHKAHTLFSLAKQNQASLLLPIDVVVAKACSPSEKTRITSIKGVKQDEMILDVGPETLDYYQSILKKMGTIIWNGPLGVFEIEAFSQGTRGLAKIIAQSQAYSVAGGGDTLCAIHRYQIADQLSYISTGGGAFLAFLQSKTLPAISVLTHKK